MDTTITPETILAVLAHRNARESEIEAAMRDCRPRAYPFSFTGTYNGEMIHVKAYWNDSDPDKRGAWKTQHEGTDFDALCDQALADIAAYKADMFGTDVERLALAIIKLKHTQGEVTDRALRMEGFTQECITAIHERAALLANEMSDGKPFEVVFAGASNEEAA